MFLFLSNGSCDYSRSLSPVLKTLGIYIRYMQLLDIKKQTLFIWYEKKNLSTCKLLALFP
jgi:hypothetical protein